jgi:hypothetical protein
MALPRKKVAMQSIGKVASSGLATTKRRVKNKVAWNATLRPLRSEPAGKKF